MGLQTIEIGRNSAGLVLRGALHLPTLPQASPPPAVLLLHGCTGSRVEDGFVYVRLARELEALGLAALRLDFSGSGESDGDFCDLTVEQELDDARCALRWLRDEASVDGHRLAVLGCSLGSTVASLLAGAEPVASLVLWAPLARPARHFFWPKEPSVREALERGEAVELAGRAGFTVRRGFYDSMLRADPVAAIARHAGPLLAVRGDRDFLPAEDAAMLLDAATGSVKELHTVVGGDHMFGARDRKDEAIATTCRFLQRTLCETTR